MLFLSKHPGVGDLDIWELTSDCYLKRIRVVFHEGSIGVFADRIHYTYMKPYITDHSESVDELMALATLEAL